MDGEVESYFETLGVLGRRIVATNGLGREISLGAAAAWVVTESKRTREEGARIFFVGNGGSAAIASHMAIDWMKNGGFAAAAFNDGAALTCLANDLGYEQVFALPLARHARPGDLIVAISSSGRSRNILAAVHAAREREAKVVTLSGFAENNALRGRGDVNFYVPNENYGFVEISHLTLCHAMLDLAMGWRASGAAPAYVAYKTGTSQ